MLPQRWTAEASTIPSPSSTPARARSVTPRATLQADGRPQDAEGHHARDHRLGKGRAGKGIVEGCDPERDRIAEVGQRHERQGSPASAG
jgi:hypothetical protein